MICGFVSVVVVDLEVSLLVNMQEEATANEFDGTVHLQCYCQDSRRYIRKSESDRRGCLLGDLGGKAIMTICEYHLSNQ